MSRYFGSSKPVKWLRTKLGIEKPYALGWGEWDVVFGEINRCLIGLRRFSTIG